MVWFKSRLGRLFEGAAVILEIAIRYGLISGAAIAAAIGQFVLAGILAVLALGIWLRFKRGRVDRSK
jgi:hypothetical protein